MYSENLPLIFGVVGHRDIDPISVKKAGDSFKILLREYRAKFPNTPILVLTSLAAGVDQLAATAALEIEGVSIGTLLPYELENYRATFATPADLRTF
jgi:hypothetical protein